MAVIPDGLYKRKPTASLDLEFLVVKRDEEMHEKKRRKYHHAFDIVWQNLKQEVIFMCAITTSNSIGGDWVALEMVDFFYFYMQVV